MKIPYTYRNKNGVYYFRWVSNTNSFGKRTALRFSLQTGLAQEARIRAYRAWLFINSLRGSENALNFRNQIKAYALHIGSSYMSTTRRTPYEPELVVLADHIGSWEKEDIQNAITHVGKVGGRLFIPFSGDMRVAYFRTHDPVHEKRPTVPLDVDEVAPQNIVLTGEGFSSAKFAKGNSFEIDEFYSYQPSCWNKKDGFFIRLELAAPIKVNLNEILISEAHAKIIDIPTRSTITSNNLHQDTGGLISEELSRFSKRKKNWTDRTRRDYESVFDTFLEIVGDKPVSKITEDDIDLYISVIQFLPPNRRKNINFRSLTAEAAASLNRETGGETLSTKSKNKYMERLHGPFNHWTNRRICRYNYLTNVDRFESDDDEELLARDPFTLENLRTIFESHESIRLLKQKPHMPSRPWGLLIALFTGARASEIFSLTLEDLKDFNGTLYFDIKSRKGHSRLKNKASKRGVPVHPKLLELGLEKYIKKVANIQKNVALPMLFPELVRSPDHGWARNTTRWINEKYLTRIGIKKDKQLVFHSFRHTVADNFKQTWKSNPLKVSAYLGHKDDFGNKPTWQKTYGSPFSPADLLEISEAIEFDIDFRRYKKEVLNKVRIRRIKNPI